MNALSTLLNLPFLAEVGEPELALKLGLELWPELEQWQTLELGLGLGLDQPQDP